MKPLVCPACGARLADGATRCDLCGYDLAEEAPREPEVASEPDPPAAPVATPPAQSGPFCTQCGTRNPAGARFCYQCGHALHAATGGRPAPRGVPVAASVPVVPAAGPEAAEPAARPDSDAGRRALALVGAGVLAVLALFFITSASKNAPPSSAQTAATASPAALPALPEDVAARAAALEDEIVAASGEERVRKQAELVRLYVQAAAFPQAARVQEAAAEEEQTALAWADAGSFYLAAMLRAEGEERVALAQRSAAAYERSLELDPSDLDVKTDLATAYLNDARNPMLAVETVKEVLAEEPDHVRANFNYGLMLAQINRMPQAAEQFEKVVALTEPEDPVHQRAEQELARVRSSQTGTAAG